MELYEDEITRLVNYLSDGDISKEAEILEYYDKLIFLKIEIKLFNTHIALRHCKSFEEIAEEFKKREKKNKPLTSDAIRKRAEKVMKLIKNSLMEKYGGRKNKI